MSFTSEPSSSTGGQFQDNTIPSTAHLEPLTIPPNEATEGHPNPFTEQELGEYKEQDRYLPIANVARIMKLSVPSNAKIAKDAKEAMQESVSEFISFITSEAAEKCLIEKRKTIGGEDIVYAMKSLGFDNYAAVLQVYLAKLRQHQAMVSAARSQAQDVDEPINHSHQRNFIIPTGLVLRARLKTLHSHERYWIYR
ncbi:histone-fold-containing protein [Cantharellus anzutake]|uniref:histone-fold-containing protein n=1 Tax=Cantharellus anzutake TaxID=1750568 RepID=UPI001902E2A2|nr:histone-fold-containing protein [Cantharellus anzutake]KAF8329393.1 histone-fold-containing protein [Cantharellus anzutake]